MRLLVEFRSWTVWPSCRQNRRPSSSSNSIPVAWRVSFLFLIDHISLDSALKEQFASKSHKSCFLWTVSAMSHSQNANGHWWHSKGKKMKKQTLNTQICKNTKNLATRWQIRLSWNHNFITQKTPHKPGCEKILLGVVFSLVSYTHS